MAMNPVRLGLTVQRDQAYQLIVPRIGFCRTRTWSMPVIGIEENTPVQGSLIFIPPQILRESHFFSRIILEERNFLMFFDACDNIASLGSLRMKSVLKVVIHSPT
jgi:hypothetical protein